jgi:hypothetical protein
MARRRLGPAQPEFLSGFSAPPAPHAPAPPIARVAGEAAAEAALRDLAETLRSARDEGRLVLALPLGDIDADHIARDRIELDAEDLAALRESLRLHGQRVPIDVMPKAGGRPWGLISGWRRLMALKALHAETGDARFATIEALVRRPETAAAAYVAMVEENEVRSGLSYFERARIVVTTTDAGIFPSVRDALRSLFASASRARRSKIGSFLLIVRLLEPHLHWPARIPERLGLRLAEALRREGADAVVAALHDADLRAPRDEIALLESLLRHHPPVSHAKHVAPEHVASEAPPESEEILPGITFRIRRRGRTRILVLGGPRLDEAMAARIRAALSALPGG